MQTAAPQQSAQPPPTAQTQRRRQRQRFANYVTSAVEKLSPSVLLSRATSHVVGLDDAKAALALALHAALFRLDRALARRGGNLAAGVISPRHLFLVGDPSSGKGYLAKALADEAKLLPTVRVSAVSAATSFSSIVPRLLAQAGGKEVLAAHAVIVLDHADQLFADDADADTQWALLSLLEGESVRYMTPAGGAATIQTHCMLFVLVGSGVKATALATGGGGASAADELLARLDVVDCPPLDETDLVTILERDLIPAHQTGAGAPFVLDDVARKHIVRRAVKQGQGVLGLRRVLSDEVYPALLLSLQPRADGQPIAIEGSMLRSSILT